eukprot:4159442-Pyramimonas_sp.AAC.1
MTCFCKVLTRRPGDEMNAWAIRCGEAKSQLDEEEVGLPGTGRHCWVVPHRQDRIHRKSEEHADDRGGRRPYPGDCRL